ncbi:glycosyl hydrolase family 8 [Paracoccus laeviglucosivorans]|uniref:cellulase n=1 Tax=Paracoccus laeviglucosivorans TaxID=1197861 RepID=A0A521D2E4_9RHOB|nr:glycosyl hydrolase family 8 [Paracoccus laeviglucosivorans]SMO65863.1 endoglucanase [Paracoccus laeviglucosivorans]
MNRRTLLSGLAAASFLGMRGNPARADMPGGFVPAGHPLHQSWQAWKTLCLTDDGRIVDGFQNSASHSEGQGYGLALAAIFDDRTAFDTIMDWSDRNLAIRDDALMAWRWRPDTVPQVQDRNNASDGDLFYAWALVMAGARQARPELIQRAARIANDIVRLCSAPHPDGSGRLLMLPAAMGFRTAEQVVVNPSYYMPRAMRELAQATDLPQLSQMADDGVALIDDLAHSGLVPDWIALTAQGKAAPPANFSQNSGYEAIRVPLFALWSGQPGSPAVQNFAQAAASGAPGDASPVVFDLTTRAVVEASSHAGYGAVAALSSCASSSAFGSAMRPFTTDQPYYPATLHLMALVAQATQFPKCVPI